MVARAVVEVEGARSVAGGPCPHRPPVRYCCGRISESERLPIGYSTIVLYPVYSIRRYRLPVPVKRHLGPGTVQYHRELDVPVQYNVPVQYATVRRVRAKRSGERNKRKVDFVSRLLELSMLSTALSVVCWSPSRIAFH